MLSFQCNYCRKDFYSKHSTAKYCSHQCSNTVNYKNLKNIDHKKYTDEELLEALKRCSIKLGKTPSEQDVGNKNGYPSDDTFRCRFGSWNRAIELAGLAPNLQYPAKKFLSRSIQPSLRFKVLQRDKFHCTYCGGSPKDGFILVVDHIIPVSKGGKTAIENLVTACWICNAGKSDILLAR